MDSIVKKMVKKVKFGSSLLLRKHEVEWLEGKFEITDSMLCLARRPD